MRATRCLASAIVVKVALEMPTVPCLGNRSEILREGCM